MLTLGAICSECRSRWRPSQWYYRRAGSFDEFMAEVEPKRRAVFESLRTECRAHFPGWSERMQWGMPGYAPDGQDALISFNDQHNRVSAYVGASAIESHSDALRGAKFGKSCARFARSQELDFVAMGFLPSAAYVAKSR